MECGELTPNDGMVKVWWWKDGAELNQEWEATKPVWEIFNAHQTFLLCVVGETIEVSEKVVLSNFVQVQ